MQDRRALGIGTPEACAQAHKLDVGHLQAKDLRFWLDHTLLKPQATAQDLDEFVAEARALEVVSACVNSFWTARVARGLAGSPVRTCTVVGFPLGAGSLRAKLAEADQALQDGSDELDLVLNIGALKSAMNEVVEDELRSLMKLCSQGQTVKVILETGLLTSEEVVRACLLARDSGVAFVKTSTGFVPVGATIEMVRLMRATVGDQIGVKASGGIRDTGAALAMIQAGASRIGCSASQAILGLSSPAGSSSSYG